MYSLFRESDNAGDSGALSELYWLDEHKQVQSEPNGRPRVGVAVRVGTPFSRSFSTQDYWTTTPITEIVAEGRDFVTFKTRSGSTYKWRKF